MSDTPETLADEKKLLAKRLKYLDETLSTLDSDPKEEKRTFFKKAASVLSKEDLKEASSRLRAVKAEVAKAVVGQTDAIGLLLVAMLAKGHVLVEALPGIAKTLLIRALSQASGCSFSRVQFTVDLLPTDITGITTFDPKTNSFQTLKGPLFSQIILGDEINRAPPKTQSALLEAMQERQVTIGTTTFPLPTPFFVMATQNPIESSGTYRLPEAQTDRFLFKISMDYPSFAEERQILFKNMTLQTFDSLGVKPALNGNEILLLQDMASKVVVTPEIEKYIVSIVSATRTPAKFDIKLGKYIKFGSSPRGSIGLFIASKALALIHGEGVVQPSHVRDVAESVLRHRILLTYEAEAENITPEDVLKEIIKKVPSP